MRRCSEQQSPINLAEKINVLCDIPLDPPHGLTLVQEAKVAIGLALDGLLIVLGSGMWRYDFHSSHGPKIAHHEPKGTKAIVVGDDDDVVALGDVVAVVEVILVGGSA
jgi:hypothetical protein